MRNGLYTDFELEMGQLLTGLPDVMKHVICNCLQEDYQKRYKAHEISAIFEK